MLWRRTECNSTNALRQLRGVRLRRCEHHDDHPSPHHQEYVAAPSLLGTGLTKQDVNDGRQRIAPFWRAALSDERIAWIGAAVAAVDGVHPPLPPPVCLLTLISPPALPALNHTI